MNIIETGQYIQQLEEQLRINRLYIASLEDQLLDKDSGQYMDGQRRVTGYGSHTATIPQVQAVYGK
jgi:hypothetical protein